MIAREALISIAKMDVGMINDVWQNSLDEDNRRFVPDEVFETIEDATEIVKQIIKLYDTKEGPFIYADIRNEDQANIGYVQLVKIDDGFEIGYHIAKKYTNHGYASRAVSLFLEYIKHYMNISEIYGIALYDNLASRKVLTKCGFETIFEGYGMYQGEERKIVKTIKKLN